MLNRSGQSLSGSQFVRRDVLRMAAGLGLSFLPFGLTAKAASLRGEERPRSLITLWMAGGPSQLETWDPHPETQVGEAVKAIDTTVSGLQIAETLPRMAEQMHHLSVIRSLVSKEGDHERGTYYVQTGYRPDPTVRHPAIGAVLARELPDPAIEIPMHVSLATGDGFVVPRGGYLGDEFDAFRIYDPGRNIRNMRTGVSDNRQERRLEGLDVVTDAFRRGRERQVEGTLHQHVIERALTMMSSPQLKAFELDEETDGTKERYGDSNFGRGCLVGRRLVEQGVRAVQVVLSGHDTHANNLEGQRDRASVLDPAFSALIEDLVERDLLESTIVLCIGEFGRTPWINPLQGRDHWPNGFSCVVGGGGLASGVVIGKTDPELSTDSQNRRERAEIKPEDPVEIPELYATILSRLGLDPSDEVMTPIGRPIAWVDGSPLERLLPIEG